MVTTHTSLLTRLREGTGREAWERFVELYTPLLFRWTQRLHLQDEEAADLVQDLFAVLVEQLPGFVYDPTKSFRAWLKTILLNRWRTYQQRRARERRVAQPDLAALVATDDAIPELEAAEYRRYLAHRALALMQSEFQPTTWQACWEFVVRDRSVEEVAREFGISVNAVYLAKSRVLRRLREELAGLMD
jgi:RNA polymerase sigma-70 factor (ECF subfamily)